MYVYTYVQYKIEVDVISNACLYLASGHVHFS